ncbi:TPA: hypothetical protein R2K44_002391 [Raoultella ornithinolytica]|nr:hypothetical protein [Raoultella ornithinolytica]
MGTFIGRGNWVFSNEEKEAFRQKKQIQFWNMVDQQRQENFNLTQLRSFLSNKDIEKYFKKADKEIRLKSGNYMRLFNIERVIKVIVSKNLQIINKKSFDGIENEELRKRILHIKLSQTLSEKGTKEKKPKI